MAIYTVNNNNDSGEGSLQQAILLANTNPGRDSIEIKVTSIELTEALTITDSVDISGNGVVLTQTGSDRLFTIDDGDADNKIDVSLSNLSLTGGKPVELGGAIYTSEDISLNSVEIYNNSTSLAGGAILSKGAVVRIENSKIYNNTVDTKPTISIGGAIYATENSKLELINSTVTNNSARTESIVIGTNSSGIILDSQITNNFGGGVGVIESQIEISNTLIDSNVADNGDLAGGLLLDYSTGIVTNSIISNNSAYIGGGISLTNSQLELANSSVIDNVAEEDGGGIDVYDNSTLNATGVTISGNSAMFTSGISSFDADLDGADISSTISILDSVVTDNVQENVVITTTPVVEPAPVEDTTVEESVEETVEVETPIEVKPTIEEIVKVEEAIEEPTVTVETPVEETIEVESPVEPNLDIAEVHRLYQYERGFHFYTTDDNEAGVIQQETTAGNLSYNYEGESFGALTSDKDSLTGEVIQGAEEVYRFFNADTGAHLYTMYEAEKEYIETSLDNYSFEGIAYYAFESEQQGIDTIPVYRMLNGDTGTHLFSTDSNEIGHIQDNLPNFSLEGDNGVAFYVLEI